MVISVRVLSVNVGGNSNSSSGTCNNRVKSVISKRSSSSEAEKVISKEENENQEEQQAKSEASNISLLVAKAPCAVWFKQQPHQLLHHSSKWVLNCYTPDLISAASQLTHLFDNIGCSIQHSTGTVASFTGNAFATYPSNNCATAPPVAAVATISITITSTSNFKLATEQDMSRESRHVHVIGLPDNLSDERVSSFFST
ncbi:unnamed protein product [Thelazia callipaeda]|uniref:RRM domain-containing protein n=1 Tax=Thelazia callipaeda TaxID=103827 RepID=A0A0N5CLW1_THECL|nr:unnamed protein product [Thelazia callipaeda]